MAYAGRALLLLAAGAALLFASCSQNSPEPEGGGSLDISDTAAPIFSAPIVEIPPDSATFGIIGFGKNLNNSDALPPRLSPAIEYYTRDGDAIVRAPCELILTKIMDNGEGVGDMELEFRTSEKSAYFIYIDHVRDVSVEEGDWVAAGEAIGLAGVSPEYRVELQVNYVEKIEPSGYGTTHYCPLDFADPDFLSAHLLFAPLQTWKLVDEIDGGSF